MEQEQPTPTPPTTQPWDRQEGESAKAYAAFLVYRNLGRLDRSLSKAGLIIYPPKTGSDSAAFRQRKRRVPGQITKWSSQWSWVERTEAWDEHIEAALAQRFLDERAAVARRQAERAVRLQEHGLKLLELIETLPDAVSHGASVRAVVSGIQIERTARGMTDAHIEVTTHRPGESPLGHESEEKEVEWFDEVLNIMQEYGLAAASSKEGIGDGSEVTAEDE